MSDESKILNVVLILLIVVGIFLFNNKLNNPVKYVKLREKYLC